MAKKTGSFVFHSKSHFQPIFDSKPLENTLKTLLNQNMATKKPINHPKTWNPPETKILLKLKAVVLGVFKVNKHLNVTPSIIWNILIQKSIVLVVKIFLNSHFLSLSWNPVSPSLSFKKEKD